MEAQADNGYWLPEVQFTNKAFVYKVREILPGRWYIQVYYRNKNGSKGGICRLIDELDGDDCRAKVYQSRYKAQKYLNKLAAYCHWEVYEE